MTADPSNTPRPIRLGISACLLGESVRFDGGHKRDPFLTETFGPLVEWVPVCPEVECGLGTPRESMRLVRVDAGIRLLTVRTAVDLTGQLQQYSQRRVGELESEDLSGYVLKRDSPSCGMERVKIYGGQGAPAKSGRGIFAASLMERFPTLPVEEEGRLGDPRLRENFVERVFAYWRLRGLFSGRAGGKFRVDDQAVPCRKRRARRRRCGAPREGRIHRRPRHLRESQGLSARPFPGRPG